MSRRLGLGLGFSIHRYIDTYQRQPRGTRGSQPGSDRQNMNQATLSFSSFHDDTDHVGAAIGREKTLLLRTRYAIT